MYILYLYVQTVTRQCFCFPNIQWCATAHDRILPVGNLLSKQISQTAVSIKEKHTIGVFFRN